MLEIANSNILEMMKAMSDCHPLQLDHTIKKSHNKDPLFLATESNNLEIVFRILIKHPQALEYMLKIKPTSPHACACFSPYLEFCFSFFKFPGLMQFTAIITVIIIFDLESF